MVAGVRGQVAGVLVPPRGFEPLISTLKGWRPRPLDDGGTGRPESTRGSGTGSSARGRLGQQVEDDRPGQTAGSDDDRDPATDPEHQRLPASARDPSTPDRAQRIEGGREEDDTDPRAAAPEGRDLRRV